MVLYLIVIKLQKKIQICLKAVSLSREFYKEDFQHYNHYKSMSLEMRLNK